jgi:DNA polymerase I-like protein with 3'-5' exonuclease and polymerase domains
MELHAQIREVTERKYTTLVPGFFPARTGNTFLCLGSQEDVDPVIADANKSKILAVDFETRGGDYSTDDIAVVGVALAYETGSVYFHWDHLSEAKQNQLWDLLLEHPGLIAHNVYFDGGIVYKFTGRHPKWFTCTYSLLATLANEGYPGANWGLKTAQLELLGWHDTNTRELDEWLITHTYYSGVRRVDESPAHLLEEYRAGTLKPERGFMYRAPSHILGKYSVLDAEACYLLYIHVLSPAVDKFPALVKYHSDMLYLIQLLIQQRMLGIPVDREGLMHRAQHLAEYINKKQEEFLSHPQIIPCVQKIEKGMLQELLATEPARYNKQKERNEPKKHNKDGSVSKVWQKWKSLVDEPPVQSKNWEKWQAKVEAVRAGENPEYRFNINSGPQLRVVLYDMLNFPVRVTTDSGLASTGVKALKHMGELGTILLDRNYAVKELTYIQAYIDATAERPTIHPSFRAPGTVSGRLTSKEPNMQQIPKSQAVMKLFKARPGYVWIDLDFSALEPVVATEFSEDPNLEVIYGNGRPVNDIYLFVGANIPGMAEKIRGAGYDPYNPTPEGLSAAKKKCKHERAICKTVVLACQYGAGVNKVMETLENDDVFLPYEDVARIHSGYWELFSRVRDFSRELLFQWRENGGYVLNGVGRPMSVPEDMMKDTLNRFIQSTGHDLLIRYIRIYTEELTRRGIEWYPLMIDWHDASCVEVREDQLEQAKQVMVWGVDELNRELNGRIKLRGEPDVGYNLSDVKKPEE